MSSKISQQIILSAYSSLLKGGLLLISPILLFSPKTRAGLKQKFGLIDKALQDELVQAKNAIWIHTVSVGEFNGAYPLIEAIKNKYPDRSLVISTTTEAGQLLAKQRAGRFAKVIYFPFDLQKSVDYFLSLIDPALVIIFETELWPNFINMCWSRKIPVVMLNARISPRSFNRYKLTKWFFGPIISKLALIGTQSEKETDNYRQIAGNDLSIRVFGNLKYDWPALVDDKANKELRNKLGIAENDLVLIAGSTHAEEEKVILNTYKHALVNSKVADKNLRLIIVPRHPERFDQVAKIIENAGYNVRRYSKNEKLVDSNDVYLLDTIGQLANFYAIASLAFVGGTIAKIGGHNLLEPYLYAVPVVCGPHLFKTRESATILSNQNALLIADNAQAVEEKIIALLQNSNLRKQMGKIGQQWLENNRGAVAKSIEAISILLETNDKKFNSNSNFAKTTEIMTR